MSQHSIVTDAAWKKHLIRHRWRHGMEIRAYTICWNESSMMPYFLRHYEQFCSKIVVYDNGSTDATKEVVLSHPRCELRALDTQGKCPQSALLSVKDEAWKECRSQAQWVICCDVDEFLFHPRLLEYLRACATAGVTIPAPQGWQMTAERFPTIDGQIYEEVRSGFLDEWYSKYVIFDPTRIAAINYEAGCHTARPTGNVRIDRSPELKLLHFKYLGLEYIVERYAALASRTSSEDIQRGFCRHYRRSREEIDSLFGEWQRKSSVVPLYI